ncbi:hypothetical protein [Laceyella tengchongensis]|uniref:hypothetical protein n=1 Tax=Laceyella tengchongensis TaxID=574699 RepID=UPI0012B7CD88|nr:hypothetical protein [Laceyella tengchongensis]
MDKDNNTNSRERLFNVISNFLGPELIIFVLIAIWYLIAYFYNLGKFHYYKLPTFYMELGFKQMLSTGSTLILVIITSFVLYFIFGLIEKIFLSLVFPIDNILTVEIIEEFDMKQITKRRWHNQLEEFIDIMKLKFRKTINRVSSKMINKIKSNEKVISSFFRLILFLFIIGTAYYYGYSISEWTENYYVLEEMPSSNNKANELNVVIETYQDYYIVVKAHKKITSNPPYSPLRAWRMEKHYLSQSFDLTKEKKPYKKVIYTYTPKFELVPIKQDKEQILIKEPSGQVKPIKFDDKKYIVKNMNLGALVLEE